MICLKYVFITQIFFYSALEICFSNILLDQFVVLKVIVAASGLKNQLI